jgi:flagellar hook-associated protein 1
MGTGIYSIGVSGIAAAQLGLLATEHNVVNASTPGFTRQRTIQSTNIAMGTGSGAIGQGVNVQTIQRVYDRFLTAQVNTALTKLGSIDAYYTQIKQIDNLLADPSAGLSPALQDFFAGVQQVAANPSLLSARQAMVSAGQTLVSRFQSIETRLTELNDQVNGKIQDTVSTINSYAKEIAEVNQRIIISQSTYGQPPNDLLDQRDMLIANLNKEIKVSTINNSDGSLSLFIGSGQQLVTGNQAVTMTALASSADNSRIVVGLKTSGGEIIEFPESLINGGALGGLTQFRAESLDRAINELGRVAATVAMTFNAQNALGMDLLGQTNADAGFAKNFFTMDAVKPIVMPNRVNTGNAVVEASFVNPPPAGGVYTLSQAVDATTGDPVFSLTRQSDGRVWTGVSDPDVDTALDNLYSLTQSEGIDVRAAGAVTTTSGTAIIYGPTASGSNFFTNLSASDYRLGYDGFKYSLVRLSDNKTWTDADFTVLSETVAAAEGFTLTNASGAMLNGDSFLIQPTRNAARNIGVNELIAGDPRLIAAAVPFRTTADNANSGTGTISSGKTLAGFDATKLGAAGMTVTYASGSPSNTISVSPITAGDKISVRLPNGTTAVYDAQMLSDPLNPASALVPNEIPFAQGMEVTVSGMTFVLSGLPNNGDTFKIAKNDAAVADSRNMLALGQLQTQNTMSGGKATYQTSYSELVASNGIKTRELGITGAAQESVLNQAQAERDALSGVNLDEEAANLIRYQQAYQASAKILEIGKTIFDTLLQLR